MNVLTNFIVQENMVDVIAMCGYKVFSNIKRYRDYDVEEHLFKILYM